jgi:hypothetical protein
MKTTESSRVYTYGLSRVNETGACVWCKKHTKLRLFPTSRERVVVVGARTL